MSILQTTVGEDDPAPLISVVIPVYNAEAWVTEAVESALAAHSDLEAVLVEDGSRDGSLEVCRRLAAEHERVRLYRHPGDRNRGAGASRNLGIRRSRGRYIAFLDADDYYLPNRFDVDVPMLEAKPDIDGVYNAVFRKREAGHVPLFGDGQDLRTFPEPVAPGDLFAALVWRERGGFHTAGVTVRREVFDRAGLFPELPLAQDIAMWLKMAAVCTLVGGNTAEPVAIYRRHGSNRATPLNPYWPQAVRRYLSSSLTWAREQRLEPAKMELLREALVTAVVRNSAYYGRRGWRRALAGIHYLVVTCWAQPSVLPVAFRRALRWLGGKAARCLPGK